MGVVIEGKLAEDNITELMVSQGRLEEKVNGITAITKELQRGMKDVIVIAEQIKAVPTIERRLGKTELFISNLKGKWSILAVVTAIGISAAFRYLL